MKRAMYLVLAAGLACYAIGCADGDSAATGPAGLSSNTTVPTDAAEAATDVATSVGDMDLDAGEFTLVRLKVPNMV